jgi:hypothetical protein
VSRPTTFVKICLSSKYLASYAFDAGLHVKCPLLLSGFNENWNVLGNFGKTPDTNFMIICRAVFQLLCINRQTDRHLKAYRHIFVTSFVVAPDIVLDEEFKLKKKYIFVSHDNWSQ